MKELIKTTCEYSKFPDGQRWLLVFTYYVEKDAWTVEQVNEEYIYYF